MIEVYKDLKLNLWSVLNLCDISYRRYGVILDVREFETWIIEHSLKCINSRKRVDVAVSSSDLVPDIISEDFPFILNMLTTIFYDENKNRYDHPVLSIYCNAKYPVEDLERLEPNHFEHIEDYVIEYMQQYLIVLYKVLGEYYTERDIEKEI